jgi:hypothetical protein
MGLGLCPCGLAGNVCNELLNLREREHSAIEAAYYDQGWVEKGDVHAHLDGTRSLKVGVGTEKKALRQKGSQ